MEPTFDFQSAMSLALGARPDAESALIWVDEAGACLLTPKDERPLEVRSTDQTGLY